MVKPMLLPDKVKMYGRIHQGSTPQLLWEGRGKLYRFQSYDDDIAPIQGGMRLIVPRSVPDLKMMYTVEVNGKQYTILSWSPVSDSKGVHHYTLTLKERKGR
jgi:hypothetical protein